MLPAIREPSKGLSVSSSESWYFPRIIMPPLNVIFQVPELCAAVDTKGTSIRLLPGVRPQVSPEVFPLTEVLATHRARVLEGKYPLVKKPSRVP